MTDYEDEEDEINALPHIVLINHEEQYSLWRADMDIPKGWRQCWGPESRDACIAWVDKVWTDMRPLSLRKAMEEDERREREEAAKKSEAR